MNKFLKYTAISFVIFNFLCEVAPCCAGPNSNINSSMNEDPNFIYSRGIQYYNGGEYELAAEHFLNVYKNHPKSSIAAQAGFYLGRMFVRLKRDKEALEVWENLYSADQFLGNKNELFKLYLQFGIINAKLEEFKRRINESKQNSYRYRIDYIDFLIFLNRIDEAAVEYEKIIKEQPSNYYIYKNIGDLYFKFQRYKEALGYYEKLLRYEPQNEVFLDVVGRCYYQLKDTANAVKYWNKIIENDKEWNKYNYLANVFQNHNMMQEAVNTYKICQQKADNPAIYFSELAELYEIINNFDELLDLYFKVMERSPSLYTIIENKITETIRKNEDSREHLCRAFMKLKNETAKSVERMKLAAVVFTGCGKFEEAFNQNLKLAQKFNSPELLEEFGILMLEFDKYELFKKSFDGIYEFFPKTEAAYSAKYRHAILLKDSGRYEESLVNLIDVKKDANFSSLYDDTVLAIGVIYLENFKKPELAFECFDEIEKKFGANVEKAMYYKALYYLYKGDYMAYGGYSDKLAKLNGEFALRLKRYDVEADIYKGTLEAAFEKAHDFISMTPSSENAPEILKDMALIMINQKSENALRGYFVTDRNYRFGDLETAENMVTRLSNVSDTCEAWLTDEIKFLKAQIFKDKGKNNEYVKILSDIQKNNSGQYRPAEAAYKLGELYLKQGDMNKASEKFSDILKEYPESMMINAAREKINKIKGGADESKRRPSFFGYL